SGESILTRSQRQLGSVVRAALNNSLVKQPLGRGGGDLTGDAVATGRLAEQGYVVRIAVEGSNVVLNPAQGQLLVLQAEVGVAQGSVGQEAEGAEAVVQRDHDHAAFHQMPGIVARTTRTVDEGATMDPDHYRIVAGFFGTVYVQEQA